MFLLIALLGGVGACLRYVITQLVQAQGAVFPYATFIINVIGSFVAGGIAMATIPATTKYVLLVGLVGAFTTFATYANELVGLLKEGHVGYAIVYCCASNVVSVVAVYGGMSAARTLLNCK